MNACASAYCVASDSVSRREAWISCIGRSVIMVAAFVATLIEDCGISERVAQMDLEGLDEYPSLWVAAQMQEPEARVDGGTVGKLVAQTLVF